MAAAIALRQLHHSVMLVDCALPPIDKACGEALMPDSLSTLKELGISLPAGAGYPFRGIRFASVQSSVTGAFPNGHALGIRRTILHNILRARATELGVALHWGVKHVRLSGNSLEVSGRLLHPKLIVAADGQNSALRRAAGLSAIRREVRRYGFRRHFAIAPWSSYMELHWGRNSQLYITPVAEREIGVALLSRNPKLRLPDELREFPEIRSRLSSAEPASSEMGALTVSRTLKHVYKRGVVLVGDASGSVDAITGEGLGLSFRQAVALANAWKSGDLELYETAHSRFSRRPALMARLLLAMDRHAGFRQRTLASLATRPEIFSSLLAVHVGEMSFSNFCSSRLLPLGLAFLAA